VIRDDLSWDGDRGMEFRLTYEGRLLASNVGGRDEKPARKEYKQGVRKQFHAQLKRLFEITPFLNTGEASGPSLEGYAETSLPKYDKEAIAAKHAHYGFNFLPLVTEELRLSCWLDILFLRRQPLGDVLQQGDIDNRLKTLFDCLQVPDANQGYDELMPDANEKPFYCLLENDRLISKISVETDRLLQDLPRPHPRDDNDARLIITVRLQPYELTFGNILFS
jgi:hypothetical protein